MKSFRNHFILCFVCFFLFFATFNVSSQKQRQLNVMHYRKGVSRNTGARVPPPLYFGNRKLDLGTANVIVAYNEGFDRNPRAKVAFQYAIDLLKQEIDSGVEIRIDALLQPLEGDILGGAGAMKAQPELTIPYK